MLFFHHQVIRLFLFHIKTMSAEEVNSLANAIDDISKNINDLKEQLIIVDDRSRRLPENSISDELNDYVEECLMLSRKLDTNKNVLIRVAAIFDAKFKSTTDDINENVDNNFQQTNRKISSHYNSLNKSINSTKTDIAEMSTQIDSQFADEHEHNDSRFDKLEQMILQLQSSMSSNQPSAKDHRHIAQWLIDNTKNAKGQPVKGLSITTSNIVPILVAYDKYLEQQKK